jgi:hypothetical protein
MMSLAFHLRILIGINSVAHKPEAYSFPSCFLGWSFHLSIFFHSSPRKQNAQTLLPIPPHHPVKHFRQIAVSCLPSLTYLLHYIFKAHCIAHCLSEGAPCLFCNSTGYCDSSSPTGLCAGHHTPTLCPSCTKTRKKVCAGGWRLEAGGLGLGREGREEYISSRRSRVAGMALQTDMSLPGGLEACFSTWL